MPNKLPPFVYPDRLEVRHVSANGGIQRRLEVWWLCRTPGKPRQFRFAGRKLPYDHRHRHASDKGVPYGFSNAHQLLKDFFEEVDRALKARQEN